MNIVRNTLPLAELALAVLVQLAGAHAATAGVTQTVSGAVTVKLAP